MTPRRDPFLRNEESERNTRSILALFLSNPAKYQIRNSYLVDPSHPSPAQNLVFRILLNSTIFIIVIVPLISKASSTQKKACKIHNIDFFAHCSSGVAFSSVRRKHYWTKACPLWIYFMMKIERMILPTYIVINFLLLIASLKKHHIKYIWKYCLEVKPWNSGIPPLFE